MIRCAPVSDALVRLGGRRPARAHGIDQRRSGAGGRQGWDADGTQGTGKVRPSPGLALLRPWSADSVRRAPGSRMLGKVWAAGVLPGPGKTVQNQLADSEGSLGPVGALHDLAGGLGETGDGVAEGAEPAGAGGVAAGDRVVAAVVVAGDLRGVGGFQEGVERDEAARLCVVLAGPEILQARAGVRDAADVSLVAGPGGVRRSVIGADVALTRCCAGQRPSTRWPPSRQAPVRRG